MLATIPTDILFEIVAHLELSDAVSLTLTCTGLRQLASERNFWILILNSARISTPIGCPALLDLSIYPLSKLKHLALSQLTLEQTWSAQHPQLRPIRPFQAANLPEPAIIIHSVQGTDVLILHVPNTGEIYCWDKREARLFPGVTHRIPTSGSITSVSVPNDSDGLSRESVAVIVRSWGFLVTYWQYIITVRHKNGKATALEYEASEITRSPDFSGLGCLFFDPHVTGCLTIDSALNVWLSTAARDHSPNNNAVTYERVAQLYNNSGQIASCCFTYRGHIYNTLEVPGGQSFRIFHLSRQLVQSKHQIPSTHDVYQYTVAIEGGNTQMENAESICFNLPTSPQYGICAVFVRSDDLTVWFTFVPCAPATTESAVTSPLDFPFNALVAKISGVLVNRVLVWLDHSGHNLAAVIRRPDGPRLTLVRYHPGNERRPATTSEHWLQTPAGIDLLATKSCCIDDTSGTVHLVDQDAVFHTLNYV
ncbi:AGC/PKA protein kinase [Mycena indigotica]|uniref:AGC/PKA protein kinase n=1 Tax=Mycena indigotica TaxID=2126181 RepID=A0A8H6RXS6_9AGAR|nr:AGC/PKA protein kinase [Mycena indigotica]KAF7289279.1 AGC/PKA protein kinase [Mycena indigotica]